MTHKSQWNNPYDEVMKKFNPYSNSFSWLRNSFSSSSYILSSDSMPLIYTAFRANTNSTEYQVSSSSPNMLSQCCAFDLHMAISAWSLFYHVCACMYVYYIYYV